MWCDAQRASSSPDEVAARNRANPCAGAPLRPCSHGARSAPGCGTTSRGRRGVQDGELSPEQREHLVTLLHLVDTAAELGRREGRVVSGNPHRCESHSCESHE